MADIPDLVRDSKFEAHFPGEFTTEVVHTFPESDPTSRRRLATRSERWKREKRIGDGGSGSVWLERCIEDTQIDVAVKIHAVRAVKQIEINTKLGSIDYIRELEAIAKFSHRRYQRYFVKSFGWYEGPSQLFIAMEYLEQGDLFTYLYSKRPLPEMEVAEIIYQILEGLGMMHENKFAHRDLKPQNILIKSHPPGEWWVKLADFGITKRIGEAHGQTTTRKGTLRYSAPEILGFVEPGSPYARDVWALGEIMFEMSTKKPVFANPGFLQKYTTNSQQFPTSLLTDNAISQAGIDFVVSLMRPHPNDRMTVASALSSLWIESRSVSIPNSSTTIQSDPNPMTTQSSTQSSDSVGIVTEELASWTTRAFAKAHENDNHARSSHTTRSNRVSPAQHTRAVAQGDISHPRARAVKKDAYYSRGSNTPGVGGPPRPTAPGPKQGKPRSQDGGSGIRHPGVLSLYEVLADTFSYWFKDSVIEKLLREGILLFEHDRFREAEPILQKVSGYLERILGYTTDVQVPQVTFHCLHLVGCCLFNLNRYREAEIILQQAFNIQEKEQSEPVFSHYGTATSPGEVIEYSISRLRYNTGEECIIEWSQFLHMVSSCLHKVGRYENAEIILVQALEIQKKVLGPDHQITRLSLQMLQEGLEITYEQDQFEEDKDDGEHREHGGAEEFREAKEANQDEGGEEAITPKPRRSRLSRFFRPSF